MDKYLVPRYLDEPMKIALLTIGEVLLLVFPVMLGLFFFNAPVVGILIGVGCVTLLKTIKGEEGHYFVAHLAYWFLPQVIKFRATPPSYIREILG